LNGNIPPFPLPNGGCKRDIDEDEVFGGVFGTKEGDIDG